MATGGLSGLTWLELDMAVAVKLKGTIPGALRMVRGCGCTGHHIGWIEQVRDDYAIEGSVIRCRVAEVV